jgi:hypothetical protein
VSRHGSVTAWRSYRDLALLTQKDNVHIEQFVVRSRLINTEVAVNLSVSGLSKCRHLEGQRLGSKAGADGDFQRLGTLGAGAPTNNAQPRDPSI